MTELRNYENTDGTTDIGDYVNSILDFAFVQSKVTLKSGGEFLSILLKTLYSKGTKLCP